MREEGRFLLEIQWSPEQIVERWRLIGSKNTLYRWIAKDRKAGGDLHTFSAIEDAITVMIIDEKPINSVFQDGSASKSVPP